MVRTFFVPVNHPDQFVFWQVDEVIQFLDRVRDLDGRRRQANWGTFKLFLEQWNLVCVDMVIANVQNKFDGTMICYFCNQVRQSSVLSNVEGGPTRMIC